MKKEPLKRGLQRNSPDNFLCEVAEVLEQEFDDDIVRREKRNAEIPVELDEKILILVRAIDNDRKNDKNASSD